MYKRAKNNKPCPENNVIKSIKTEEDTADCEISAAENFIKEI